MVSIGKYNENVSEDATFCLDVKEKLDIRPIILPDLKVGYLKEIYI